MIVKTRNSWYDVKEHGPEAKGRFSVLKIKDAYPGGHPNVPLDGRVRWGNSLVVEIGRDMILSQRTDGRAEFRTTEVIEVIP